MTKTTCIVEFGKNDNFFVLNHKSSRFRTEFFTAATANFLNPANAAAAASKLTKWPIHDSSRCFLVPIPAWMLCGANYI